MTPTGNLPGTGTIDDRMATTLDDTQLSAVHAPLGPLAIMAGPGSGKTATLVARIAHLCRTGQVDPSRCWALCHTTKAAGELRDRLRRAGVGEVTCSTVHAAAWRQVRRWWAASGRAGEPKLAASTWKLVRAAARPVLGDVDSSVVSDLASEIEWATAQLLDPDRYPAAARTAGRTPPAAPDQVAEVWRRFVDAKQSAGVLDFSDVLAVAADMLAHPEVGPDVRSRLDAVFVDEYQDIDPAQQRLVDGWLADGGHLCVVGDEDQAVFGFKGADPSFLTGFADRNPAATVVRLDRNWRSTPQVVEWVNRLATPGRPPLVGMGEPGPEPRVLTCTDEAAEERALVDQLRRWRAEGIAPEEMAVLYRFNSTAARVESALTAAGVPHHVAGNDRFFDRPEVRAVLVPFGRAARANPDADGFELLVDAATDAGFDPNHPPEGAGVARQRWEAVAALMSLVTEQCAGLSARWLLAELQQRASAAHDLTPGGVTLATIHAAKGLEWDAVWVLGAVEGQIPSAFAKTPAQLAEERRLLYVAASRPRVHLVISAAMRRHNNWSSTPSRFLDALREPTTRRRAPAGRSTRHARSSLAEAPAGRSVGECRRCGRRLTSAAARRSHRCGLGCLDPASAEARYHDQLVAWRAARADQLGVAPEDLATDRALFHIAVTGETEQVRGLSADAHPVPPPGGA